MIPQPVRDLADMWSEWQVSGDGFPFGPAHCLNGTRVAIGVLRHFGVKATPFPVRMMMFNRTAWDLYQAGVPVDEWPKKAWSIGIGFDKGRGPGWDGHLMCEGEGFTLDISARQFHRPGLIDIPGPIVLPGNLPHEARGFIQLDEGRLSAIVERSDDWSYKFAPGWARLQEVEIAETIRRMGG